MLIRQWKFYLRMSFVLHSNVERYEDPSQFEEADRIIIEKIRDLNAFFHIQNASPTPKLSEDFNKNTKNRKAILGIFII